MYFLTINAGSSSIKFGLFDDVSLAMDYSGTVSGIGYDSSSFSLSGKQSLSQQVSAVDHLAGLKLIQDWIGKHIEPGQLSAIGHRVVHGGPRYSSSQLINDEVLTELSRIVPLDPEHLLIEIKLIEQLAKDNADVPQFACFDTAFFHNLPTEARLLPLPRKFEADGVRRYGFHGLSYTYLMAELERVAGREAANGKVILAHLGSGVSIAAVKDKKPIDTSMGMTPVGGLPMATRSGDLDPGALVYLAAQKGMSPEQLAHLVGFESGLIGISETSADMKQLLELESGDPRAQQAVNMFCYQARKYIGAYAAALGGLDSLVFSGGMGEASAPVRARICEGLEFLGVKLDPEQNNINAQQISEDGSRVKVYVLPTNEAVTMAKNIKQLMMKG